MSTRGPYKRRTNGTWDVEPEPELTAIDLMNESELRQKEIDGIISYILYETTYQMDDSPYLRKDDKIKILSRIRNEFTERIKQLKGG